MSDLFSGRTAALLLFSLVFPPRLEAALAVRFFAFGDLPYTTAQAGMLRSLLSDVLEEAPPFLVHVGDVKSGSEPCTEDALGRVANLFRVQSIPVVFTPGDNDWTDCRRASAGAYDPAERLALLRRLYYDDPEVLRLQELEVSRKDAAYPENFWFIYKGVIFATLHVVGSDNNLVFEDQAAAAEVVARSEANRRHLRAVVQAANAADVAAFVLLFHADPGLEEQSPPRGFDQFHRDLRELLRDYTGPILAIHGDSHNYQLNHPLLDLETGRAIKRFTRLEVPGPPTVAGVWVTLTPESAGLVSVELAYPGSEDGLFK